MQTGASPCVAKEECNPAIAEVKRVEACHSLCEVVVRNPAAASALRLELIYVAGSHAIDCSVSVCELALTFLIWGCERNLWKRLAHHPSLLLVESLLFASTDRRKIL